MHSLPPKKPVLHSPAAEHIAKLRAEPRPTQFSGVQHFAPPRPRAKDYDPIEAMRESTETYDNCEQLEAALEKCRKCRWLAPDGCHECGGCSDWWVKWRKAILDGCAKFTSTTTPLGA